jgi:ABC-2 type transport system ATP-binding protein
MDEAEICSKLAIMDHGKIVAFDSPYNLKKQHTSNVTRLRATDEKMLQQYLTDHSIKYKLTDGLFKIYSTEIEVILEMIAVFKTSIIDFETSKGTLNDVFLAITGKEIRA